MDATGEFLGALQAEQGASPNTLSAYRRDLAGFGRFLTRRRRGLMEAEAADVVAYVEIGRAHV